MYIVQVTIFVFSILMSFMSSRQFIRLFDNLLMLSSQHEWTTWAACDQSFEVIQKIKEGVPWKATAMKEDL